MTRREGDHTDPYLQSRAWEYIGVGTQMVQFLEVAGANGTQLPKLGLQDVYNLHPLFLTEWGTHPRA
jgi:hypothetical protein